MEEIETWGDCGSTSLDDICFRHKGKYVDICSEYRKTWNVRFDNNRIGIGHNRSGTGFGTRKEAFDWAKKEIGFSKNYEDVIG